MAINKDSHNMAKRVQEAIRDTKEYFAKAYPDEELADDSFAYITAELLEYYDKYTEPKDEEQARLAKAAGLSTAMIEAKDTKRASRPELLETWTYYGHHVVLNGSTGKASFINDNQNTGPDNPSNRCWGYKAWTVSWSSASPSSACPSNSQGYGTLARGIR